MSRSGQCPMLVDAVKLRRECGVLLAEVVRCVLADGHNYLHRGERGEIWGPAYAVCGGEGREARVGDEIGAQYAGWSTQVARRFHEAYERHAPHFGYVTRRESAVPWDEVPTPNRRLMERTVATALRPVVIDGRLLFELRPEQEPDDDF